MCGQFRVCDHRARLERREDRYVRVRSVPGFCVITKSHRHSDVQVHLSYLLPVRITCTIV